MFISHKYPNAFDNKETTESRNSDLYPDVSSILSQLDFNSGLEFITNFPFLRNNLKSANCMAFAYSNYYVTLKHAPTTNFINMVEHLT